MFPRESQSSDDWSEIGGPPIGRLLAALPRHLVERASLVGGGEPARGASCVLYWAHHALRVEENPALELAAELAERLHLPLLVLSTLAGSHPYLSDRHAAFVLEGMRDFAFELAAIGVPFAASLDASVRPHRSTRVCDCDGGLSSRTISVMDGLDCTTILTAFGRCGYGVCRTHEPRRWSV